MKLLLDENLPHELRKLLSPPHDVFTVTFMGWSGVSNGELMKRAAAHAFDALITTDRGYEHQQNFSNLPCCVLLLLGRTNKIDDLQLLVPALLSALTSLPPKSLVKIS